MALETVTSVEHLRSAVADARRANRTIGFIPTMGALHAGHVSLFEASRRNNDFTIVSIFVNPTQFGPGDDFDRYPRTLDADRAICDAAAAQVLFVPQHEDVYPKGDQTRVRPGPLADGLCGPFRPGHFEGVCTVVAKLFGLVQPDVAYFGQKDAQQVAIIRRMVVDLRMPLRIEACPIVREPDGLALSSRNAYLEPDQRRPSLCLYQALTTGRDMLRAGESVNDAVAAMRERLERTSGVSVDYVSVVDPDSLDPVTDTKSRLMVAGAIRIGSCRLIDNVLMDLSVDRE
ncbi:MAG: pantoate--beta-alanine ligase [Planctomycetota bacterium]|nr:pantoate--beta-alanine ligase [Planctomycetota bacterium]